MTDSSKKEQLYQLIRANPFISQQDLAVELRLSRSAVAGHIAGLIRERRLLGRGEERVAAIEPDRIGRVGIGVALTCARGKRRPIARIGIEAEVLGEIVVETPINLAVMVRRHQRLVMQHAAIAADIANFKEALKANGYKEGFMTSVAPGSVARLDNRHYKTDDEFMFACADAMRHEYKAIVDAGLILQLDDPSIAENWDSIDPAPSVAAYRKFTMRRVDALNHALHQALLPTYPRLAELHLTDYKVRVVDSKAGTAAQVRVLIEHQFKGRTFGTVGVSENVIEASWDALVEGIECALQA